MELQEIRQVVGAQGMNTQVIDFGRLCAACKPLQFWMSGLIFFFTKFAANSHLYCARLPGNSIPRVCDVFCAAPEAYLAWPICRHLTVFLRLMCDAVHGQGCHEALSHKKRSKVDMNT